MLPLREAKRRGNLANTRIFSVVSSALLGISRDSLRYRMKKMGLAGGGEES